jgi:putative ABC transport system permease protein
MFSFERLRFYLKHSINDLRVNGRRTIFGLFCISSGVAAIVGLLTLGVMVDDSLTGDLQESNRGDIRVTPLDFYSEEDADDAPDTFGITPAEFDRYARWFADQEGVDVEDMCTDSTDFCVTGQLGFNGSLIFFEDTLDLVGAFTVDSDAYPLYGDVESEDGVSLANGINVDSYQAEGPADVFVSRNLADKLEMNVGDEFNLLGVSRDLKVSGIVPTRTEGGVQNIFAGVFGYVYLDDAIIDSITLDDLGEGESDESVNNYAQIFVRLDDPSRTTELADAFEARYGQHTDVFTTEDLREVNEDISTIVTQFNSIMGLLALLIGGIGIVNTMLVVVRRRTNEVAILKTLGLQPGEVSTLFFVESIIMGIIGSVVGIPFGFLIAYVTKGAVGAFIAEDLAFRIALEPIGIGLVVGTMVTAIFGLLPILSAGQVRPATVLQPQITSIPKAGIARSIFALAFIIVALSVVAQGLLNDLLSGDDIDLLRNVAQYVIGVLGLIMGVMMVISGLWYSWTQRNILLRVVRWGLLLGVLPVAAYLLGQELPSVAIILGVFVIAAILYVLLWLIIWIEGLFFPTFTLLLVVIPFGTLLLRMDVSFLSVVAICILLYIVLWLIPRILGRVFPAFRIPDIKIATRAMLAAKGRVASTLLALIIGVFTLSLVYMLVTTISDQVENLLEDVAGGNIIVFTVPEELQFGGDDGDAPTAIDEVQTRLDAGIDGVESYGILRSYDAELISYTDVSRNETLDKADLTLALGREDFVDNDDIEAFYDAIQAVDARSVNANLPDVNFSDGRQLGRDDAFQQVIVVPDDTETQALGFSVGDQLTYRLINPDKGQQSEEITFTIVGLSQIGDIESFGSRYYVPLNFMPQGEDIGVDPTTVAAVVNANEEDVEQVAKELRKIDNVLVLETRLFNDIVNRLLDTFTSLPLVVSIVVLITGGVVIANSVALAMLERRREIAIMKSVGLQRRRVLSMLLLENGVMGVIGGLIGVGISSLVLFLALVFLFQSELGEAIPITQAFIMMAVCIGITLVAAVLSVWGASSEKPLNVLRYE